MIGLEQIERKSESDGKIRFQRHEATIVSTKKKIKPTYKMLSTKIWISNINLNTCLENAQFFFVFRRYTFFVIQMFHHELYGFVFSFFIKELNFCPSFNNTPY